jgi:membrane peptidoglycan carboxypeptidase
VSQLNAAEGAVLAATISSPSYYDPAVNKAAAVSRWHYVVDGMVKQHWLPASAQTGLKYPTVKPPPRSTGSGCTGYKSFICSDVQLELAKQGFDAARLSSGGYKVVTTIDKKAEDAAAKAEADQGGGYLRSGVDKGRESALVSVQPGDGAIRALYGGRDACSSHPHPDQCTDLTGVAGLFGSGGYARPPGSSFKPYTVIAALKEGIGLDSTFHGPPSIQVNGSTINNSQGESCGTCTLTEALAKSINTVFVPLAIKVGPDKVVQSAYDAGIPKKRQLAVVPTITLGVTDVAPIDQATGFATIAAQGVRAEPYLVARVENLRGDVVYKAKKTTTRVFDAPVMADTTYAMTKVLDCGSGGTACGKALTGRPAAGKTGTNGGVTGNKDAWFIGFTPQLSTAVWFGNHDRNAQVTTNGAPLYGGDLPAATWQEMMNAALLGAPVQSFPPPAHVGTNKGNASPTPSKSTTGSPTNTPSATPSSSIPTPTPTLTILPSGSGSPTPSPTPSPTGSPSAAGSPAHPSPAPKPGHGRPPG